MTNVITEEMECTLKDDLEITKKVKALAGGVFKWTKKGEPGIPTLESIQRQSKDTWILDIEMIDRDQFVDADSFNERLNKVGKRVFGDDNFNCDKAFKPGTGQVVMNYEVVTTCKIKFPEPAPMKEDFKYQGKKLKKWDLLKAASEIKVNWKGAISRDQSPVSVGITNKLAQGFMDSDLHHIREVYYWTWCKT